jgi:hypothetical protein
VPQFRAAIYRDWRGVQRKILRVSEECSMTAITSEQFGADTTGPDNGEAESFAPERRTPERLGEIDLAVTAFEGEIREFVRRDVSIARHARGEMEQHQDPVADNLSALIQRVSGASIEEIDRVILELQSVRDMLRNEGDRITREIAGYASLSHAAMTAMKVIGDSLMQWNSAPPTSPAD